jgi:hypothetical protein
MLLYKAEMKYRDGAYDEAIALADEVTANAQADEAYAAYIPEAAAYKAVALLLSDRAQEALELLRPFVEEGAQVSNSFVSTLLAAAVAAGDEAYYDSFEQEQLEIFTYYYGYSMPDSLEALKAGETTVEAIFTEGWGGFDA